MLRGAFAAGLVAWVAIGLNGREPPNVTKGDAPSARSGHAMATAGSLGGVLMLGGAAPEGDGLWRLADGAWQRLGVGGLAPRAMLAAAFDTHRQVLVVFGGAGVRNGSRYGDTWEWNGRAWAERDVRTPGARDHHAMAYDEARRQVVMYGGWNGDHAFPTDTWTWDGIAWTQADTTTGPGGIGHLAMAYDARRQRVVLFGGDAPGRAATGDTWEWDGTHWANVATEGPAARTRHRMAYDAARGVTVLFGGQNGTGPSATYPDDTWTWDGKAWTRIEATGPSPRWVHAMAYDQARQRVVLFGGGLGGRPFNALGDTWEWDGARWTEIK